MYMLSLLKSRAFKGKRRHPRPNVYQSFSRQLTNILVSQQEAMNPQTVVSMMFECFAPLGAGNFLSTYTHGLFQSTT